MIKPKIIMVHKSKLSNLENNPRQIVDPDGPQKLKYLINKFGFRGCLEIFRTNEKKNYEIIAGNHRFDAGVSLGMTTFPCEVFHGTRKEALARALSDNKSNEWTNWDYPKLKDILTDIDDGKTDMNTTGFDQEEIQEMFEDHTGGGGSGEPPEPKTCPECGAKL